MRCLSRWCCSIPWIQSEVRERGVLGSLEDERRARPRTGGPRYSERRPGISPRFGRRSKGLARDEYTSGELSLAHCTRMVMEYSDSTLLLARRIDHPQRRN